MPVPMTLNWLPVKLFLTQHHHLDPETTLYTSFFGIKYVVFRD
jgi:hypothetical protein